MLYVAQDLVHRESPVNVWWMRKWVSISECTNLLITQSKSLRMGNISVLGFLRIYEDCYNKKGNIWNSSQSSYSRNKD